MTPSNISHAYYSEKVSPSNDSKQKDDNGDMNGMSADIPFMSPLSSFCFESLDGETFSE